MLNVFKKKPDYDPSLKPRGFGEMSPEEYISERLNDQIKYYDKTANRAKKTYLINRTIIVVAGAVVPVLINIDFPHDNLITSFFSLLVVLIVSLESVYHNREQWINSRSTSEALRKEYFLYSTKEGPYTKLESSQNDAFILFVERIEYLIESENNSTLQVMTRESKTEKVMPHMIQPPTDSKVTGKSKNS